MKKVMLFFVLMIGVIACISFASAQFAQRHNNVMNESGSIAASEHSGVQIVPTTNLVLLSVNKTAISQAAYVILRNNSNQNISVANFTGVTATFSAPQLLQSNVPYRLAFFNSSGSWIHNCAAPNPLPFPVNSSFLIWNSSLFNNATGDPIYFCNVFSLSVDPTSAVTNLISPADNSVALTNPVNFSALNFGNATDSLVNATFFLYAPNGTLFNMTTIGISGSQNSSNFSVSNMNTPGGWLWNVRTCTTNSCNFAPYNFTVIRGFMENSQTFNSNVLGGTVQPFTLNITIAPEFHATLVYLIYNNTAYLADSVFFDGTNYIYGRNVTVPTVTSPVVKNFFWQITLSNGGITTFNSTTRSQTLSNFQVDTCSAFTQNILNFTLYDEDTLLPLNGTIQVDVTFYTAGTTTILGIFNSSYAFTSSSGPARVCINQTNTSLEMDWHALYFSNVSLYPVEHKFAQKVPVTNTTQSVSLYNILDARQTPFQIILQSASLDSISGALIDIQREYVYLGQFISVETPLTNVYGTAIGHFVAEEPYYTFVISKDGEILGTFERQQVKCQNVVTGDCRITLNLIESSSDPPDFQTFGNISVTYNWSQSTRTLRTLWLSADGSSHTVLQNVTLFDNWGNNTVCSTTGTGISGTYVCTVPDGYGNQSIISYLYSDGRFIGFATFNLGDSASDIFGGTKVVLGIMMYTTLTLLMIANPVSLMIGSILGMAFIVAFHIADGGSFIGNSSIFLWFVIAAGIVIYHISKRNS